MDEARLKEIESRLNATTPGPWRHGSLSEELSPLRPRTEVVGTEDVDPDDLPDMPRLGLPKGTRVIHTFTLIQPTEHVFEREPDEDGERREWTDWLCRCEADARFFAHSVADIRDLLAEVRRLKGYA